VTYQQQKWKWVNVFKSKIDVRHYQMAF